MTTQFSSRKITLLGLIAGLFFAAPGGPELMAQGRPVSVRPTAAPAPAASIERAALNYIQWVASRAKIPHYSIDARRLATGQGEAQAQEGGGYFYGKNIRHLTTQQSEPLLHLAKIDSFEVIGAERVASCLTDPLARGCVRDGRFTLLTFGMPTITGTGATLEVVIYGYLAPKEPAQGQQPTPVSLGGTAIHSLYFTLEHRGSLWHVTANRWLGP